MTRGDQLRAAAGYVRGGWTTGLLHNAFGDCCALGAIENALVGERLMPFADKTYDVAVFNRLVAPVMASAGLRDPHDLIMWNNHGNTAENVAATFELAAILADQEDAQPAKQEATSVLVAT